MRRVAPYLEAFDFDIQSGGAEEQVRLLWTQKEMREVIVVCEGQTEGEFCKSVIAPYLLTHGIHLAGKLAGKPNRRQRGIRNWQAYRKERL